MESNLIRIPPKASLIALTTAGLLLTAADPPKKPAPTAAINKPKMPAVPPMDKRPKLWALQPIIRPEVPAAPAASTNPIDAFAKALYATKKVMPLGPASKQALLRRVYMDLIGIPPTPAEQDA